MREVAARTGEMAGDGTSTATVPARDMITDGLKYLAAGMNPMDLRQGEEQAVETAVQALRDAARPCTTTQEMAHVAMISANNDRSIGDLIARAMEQVGRERAVSIEDGSGMVSELEVVEGMQFDRGYLSPYFINNAERQSVVLDNPRLLVCDRRLSSVTDLVGLLEHASPRSGQSATPPPATRTAASATTASPGSRAARRRCAPAPR